MEIGAQLYTVRDHCKTLEDFAETLKKIADIGYRCVQVSGTCPYPADWLRDQLTRNGLRCVLTHIPVPRLTGETDQVIADHDVFDCRYIGLGWWSFRPEDNMSLERWMELFPPVARRIAGSGHLFMYHNHDQEFQRSGGSLILGSCGKEEERNSLFNRLLFVAVPISVGICAIYNFVVSMIL